MTRHFSRLAAPDAIARVELFYLPIILTTHAAFFLSLILATFNHYELPNR